MTEKQLENLVKRMARYIQKQSPIDTGNLRSSIRLEQIRRLVYRIYVNWGGNPYLRDYPRGLAPYMPFTNEPWISPRWNGKKNPNEGWWENACENVIKILANKTGGKLNANYKRLHTDYN